MSTNPNVFNQDVTIQNRLFVTEDTAITGNNSVGGNNTIGGSNVVTGKVFNLNDMTTNGRVFVKENQYLYW